MAFVNVLLERFVEANIRSLGAIVAATQHTHIYSLIALLSDLVHTI